MAKLVTLDHIQIVLEKIKEAFDNIKKMEGNIDSITRNAGSSYFNTTFGTDDQDKKPVATGFASTAIAPSATAGSNMRAVAIGNAATATGDSGVAIGPWTNSAENCVAIGDGATASSPNSSIAVGDGATVSGTLGIAIGAKSKAPHSQSVALGNHSKTTADNQIMVGKMVYASDGKTETWTYRRISGVATPTDSNDAATKQYVDQLVPASPTIAPWTEAYDPTTLKNVIVYPYVCGPLCCLTICVSFRTDIHITPGTNDFTIGTYFPKAQATISVPLCIQSAGGFSQLDAFASIDKDGKLTVSITNRSSISINSGKSAGMILSGQIIYFPS